jgi:uncharacterized protein with FMN-binding domain
MQYRTGLILPLLALTLAWGCAGFGSRGPAGLGQRAVDTAETAAEGPAAETGTDGVYEGIGRGYRGTIRVRLRMEAGAVTEITIVESGEDRAVGGTAMEELLDLVLMYNSTDLDAVSGATESSQGFLAAVENALSAAQSPWGNAD